MCLRRMMPNRPSGCAIKADICHYASLGLGTQSRYKASKLNAYAGDLLNLMPG